MKTWSKAGLATAIAKTAGTFDKITTIQLKSTGVATILGFEILAIPVSPTAGENGVPILRINSDDLGISNQEVILSYAETDGISTNSKEVPVFAEFIPWKAPNGSENYNNAQIDLYLSTNVTNTTGFNVAASVIYADNEPDNQFQIELQTGITCRASGGKKAEADAAISAAAYTSFANGIQVNSRASELIGLSGFVNTNATTAGENAVSVTKFEAAQINDFSPQEWVANFGYTASIGTPVGQNTPANRRNGFYHPTRFPLPKTNFTIDVSQKLAAALTNAADGLAAAKWR